ncbi:MAG: hypothetical protein KGL35_15430 [Bradyrhizobium sp.]|nr:hypothetical protein [Bradyrhizobium sp.]
MASVTPTQGLVLRPGRYPVQLGSIVFSTEETPPKWIGLGGGQQMTKQFTLPGGTRIIQDFGNSASDIRWTGKFWGTNVDIRVKQVRAYRVSGQPQILTWRNEKYLVKIKSFEPGYRGRFNEFEMVLEVVQDLNGAFTVSSPASVDAMVASLQAQVTNQQAVVSAVDPTGAASYQSQLNALNAAISAASPLSQTSAAQSASLQALVSAASAAVSTYQTTLSTTAVQYPYTQALIDTLDLISLNVQRGQVPTTQTVYGGNLFTVAALQYGDVSQAFNLAASNGLVSPLLALSSYSIAVPAAAVNPV